MVDWTIPQCDKIPKKSLIYPKLQYKKSEIILGNYTYLNTGLNSIACNFYTFYACPTWSFYDNL